MKTAILFLTFNRPDTTKRVFDAIRAARPPRLYVASDGPRPDHLTEAAQCEEVRRIATTIDWPCELKTLFRESNLGCRRAVSGALDWFFNSEESGIILEDDCLPSPSWFPFAEEMLDRYRNDERVMCISANHFHDETHRPDFSYFFSIYTHSWGWASWRRAWRHYDHEMIHWPGIRDSNWLLRVGNGDRAFRKYWTSIFDMAYHDTDVDAWDYRWTFSCWIQNGLTILPAKNLVVNIGIGKNSTHTSSAPPVIKRLSRQALEFPLKHPDTMVCDVDADAWTTRYVFGVSKAKILRKKLERAPVIAPIFRVLRKAIRRS